ncbi:hypothetical protein CCHR01_12953 [Colletotrichum chrysophilum]|uniref:Uncharacterized protein n=1 Tax=Colletotrichum chrysophilum TaxID=1836956 RepID=A0AAD9AAC1_9PEZI|nr:hypothetical protein CCHR01_12953 [Colletotrichum chrysophilum]
MDFLRRGRPSNGPDIEQQALAGPSTQPEMQEDSRPRPRRLPGTRPALSSRRHPGGRMQRLDDGEDDSPKTPRFNIGLPTLPSTRLNLPHLARTWTSGSNGPNSRPSSGQPLPSRAATDPLTGPYVSRAGATQIPVAMPSPVAQHARSHSHRLTRRFTGPDPAELHLAQMAQEGRRRRRRRQRNQEDNNEGHPKRFLLCLPWVKSRRMRSQILRCFISGTFLALLLAVYLALSLTQNIRSSEFTVLLILIILFTTIFFCHGLIRLCMLVIRPRSDDEARPPMPQLVAPGGYAVPREPIRVVLARDEEEEGEISDAAKAKPPAYGLWRESVRVDPNRIYWQRNPNATSNGSPSNSREVGSGPRPPSYASEDGVSYVVDARPRSMAPGMTEVLPPHPSEVGRMNERRGPW